MAESYYPSDSGDEAAPSEAGSGVEGSEHKPDERMGETTLVPKSMFEGKELKPGDEFYFTVVRIHENEVEVEYKHDEKKEHGEEEEMGEGSGGMDESPEKAFDSKFSMMGGGGGGGY